MTIAVSSKILSGISPARIIESYRERALDRYSDQELFQAAAESIARPKVAIRTSFEFHAPLELLARMSLLPLVAPEQRELARIQMVGVAAHYEAGGAEVPDPEPLAPACDRAAAQAELRAAIEAGDTGRADAFCVSIAEQFGARGLIESLASLALKTLTAAAHIHIGLYLMARMWGDLGAVVSGLARAGARALAEGPDVCLKPVRSHREFHNIELELGSILRDVPVVKASGPGVRGMIQAPEEAGLFESLIGDSMLTSEDEQELETAFKLACRVAAVSMLEDNAEQAKYGWSHTLTMPQAAWSLTRFLPSISFGREAAHSALTWVIGFRSTIGSGALPSEPNLEPSSMPLREALSHSPRAAAASVWSSSPDDWPEIVRELATAAAIRVDAHLVKYVRSSLDAAVLDPEHARLYYSAAAYLAAVWSIEHPEEHIPETLTPARA